MPPEVLSIYVPNESDDGSRSKNNVISNQSNFVLDIAIGGAKFYRDYFKLTFSPNQINAAIVPPVPKVQTNEKPLGSKTQTTIAILQINVRHSPLTQFLALKTAREMNAKLILISEPYLFRGKLALTVGWRQISASRAAILIDENLSYTEITLDSNNTVAIELENVLIVSTYHSPTKVVDDGFLTLQKLVAGATRVILAGDFNCRHPAFTSRKLRKRDRAFLRLTESQRLHVANYNASTWNGGKHSSINDYTLYKRVNVEDWQVLDELESLSDHRYIAYKIDVPLTEKTIIRKDNETDEEKLRKTELLQFEEPRDRKSCDELATTVTDFLIGLIRNCSDKGARIPKSLWNDDVEVLYRTLKKLERKIEQKIERTVAPSVLSLINTLSVDVKGMIKEAKRKACIGFFIQSRWRRKYNKTESKNRQAHPKQLIPDETLLLEKIGRKPPLSHPPEVVEVAAVNEDETVDCNVTEVEIERNLKSVKRSWKSDRDRISYKSLKVFHKKQPSVLPALFSTCLRFRLFPEAWKRGHVVWHLKPNQDPSAIDSYRPITQLSSLAKIFEKSIASRMWAHINEKGIISSRQFGFVAGKSKHQCIRSLLADIAEHRNNYDLVAVIKLDIKAAFDNISWNHLLGELRRYHFPAYLVDIIASFLENRVVTSGTASILLEKGCPQGSALGSILWNLSYNFVLENFVRKGKSVICYADDTAFVLAARNQNDLIEEIRSTILETTRLISRAGLQLKEPKTKVMILNGYSGWKEKPKMFEFDLAGQNITTVESFKYLGVTINNELKQVS